MFGERYGRSRTPLRGRLNSIVGVVAKFRLLYDRGLFLGSAIRVLDESSLRFSVTPRGDVAGLFGRTKTRRSTVGARSGRVPDALGLAAVGGEATRPFGRVGGCSVGRLGGETMRTGLESRFGGDDSRLGLELRLGGDASRLGLELRLGVDAWRLGLELRLGGDAWRLALELRLGGDASRLGLELRLGGDASRLGLDFRLGGEALRFGVDFRLGGDALRFGLDFRLGGDALRFGLDFRLGGEAILLGFFCEGVATLLPLLTTVIAVINSVGDPFATSRAELYTAAEVGW